MGTKKATRTKRWTVALAVVTVMVVCFLCSCSIYAKSSGASEYEVEQLDGVSLELTEISGTSGSVSVHNGTGGEITTYPWFMVEVRTDDGWDSMKYKYYDHATFPSSTFPIEVGEDADVSLNIEHYFGALRSGSYRLLMRVTDSAGSHHYIACEFEV